MENKNEKLLSFFKEHLLDFYGGEIEARHYLAKFDKEGDLILIETGNIPDNAEKIGSNYVKYCTQDVYATKATISEMKELLKEYGKMPAWNLEV